MHHKIAHAVVTGAGGGIGSAIAVVLLASGIKVSLMGRKLEPLEATIALSNGTFELDALVLAAWGSAAAAGVRAISRKTSSIDERETP